MNRLLQELKARTRSEEGFTIVFFSLIIVIAVMVMALVIDHAKEEISAENVQRAADAASLAGARQLNGNVDGWRKAKNAALVAVKANPIHGVTSAEQAALQLSEGKEAFWDTSNRVSSNVVVPETGTEGTSGNFKVVLERGIFWADPEDSSKYKFVSLEDTENGQKFSGPIYLIANAVRTKVTVPKLDTIFGGIFATASFDNVTATAIAVMHSQLEYPILPGGIPLCQLLFDTNPENRTNHTRSSFSSTQQCMRGDIEVRDVISNDDKQFNFGGETLPAPTIPQERRKDGLTKSQSYPRPPYFNYTGAQSLCFQTPWTGAAQNCKSTADLFAVATLGVPQQIGDSQVVATADEVREAVTNLPSARIGTLFKPLYDLDTLVTDHQAFSDALNRSTLTFGSAFLNGGAPKPNYPFLRTSHPPFGTIDPQGRPITALKSLVDDLAYDLKIQYPIAGGNIQMLMHDMSQYPSWNPQLNYTNPMCHDPNVTMNNPDVGRVRDGYIAVLVPGVDRLGSSNGSSVNVTYCDWDNVFSLEKQQAVAVLASTRPTIAGYLHVRWFDFNFDDLDARFRPGASSDPSVQLVATPPGDNNAAYLDPIDSRLTSLRDEVEEFHSKFDTQATCLKKSDPPNDCKENHPNDLRLEGLGDLAGCWDFAALEQVANEISGGEYNDFKTLLNSVQPQECEGLENESQCGGSCAGEGGGKIQYDGHDVCCVRWCYKDQSKIKKLLDELSKFFQQPIPAKPNTHCLLVMKTGRYDKNDPNSYQPMRSVKAGVGCGALRMRSACEGEKVSVVSGQDWNLNSPALVVADGS